MTILAVSDSEAARQLLLSGTSDAEYLEIHGVRADDARAAFPNQPMLLHNAVFDWSLADAAPATWQRVLPKTFYALERTHAPWLSVHLGFSAARVDFDRWMCPRSPVLPRDELLTSICHSVRALARSIHVPLLLENVDYNPGGAYEHVSEPEFIAAVLDDTEVGLLLDLAHARVSAAHLGRPIADYLAAIPLDRVRQLHVSGPRLRRGVLVDAHAPLTDEDFVLLEQVLAAAGPLALTLESRGNTEALVVQLRRLRALVDGPSG
jgi:uncharacterized protein (UPF0276 family)